jgi:hypothetical protein
MPISTIVLPVVTSTEQGLNTTKFVVSVSGSSQNFRFDTLLDAQAFCNALKKASLETNQSQYPFNIIKKG